MVLRDFLEQITSADDAMPLHVDHVPNPLAKVEPDQFNSDAHALHLTHASPGWKGAWGVPVASMRFGSCFTKNAFLRWHIAPHGFAKFIQVVHGALWVFIARPDMPPGTSDFRSFSSIDLFFSFNVNEANHIKYDMEAILLEPGTRL